MTIHQSVRVDVWEGFTRLWSSAIAGLKRHRNGCLLATLCCVMGTQQLPLEPGALQNHHSVWILIFTYETNFPFSGMMVRPEP